MEKYKNFIDWLYYTSALRSRPDGKFQLRLEKRLKKRIKATFDLQRDWYEDNFKWLFEDSLNFGSKNTLEAEIDASLDEMPYRSQIAEDLHDAAKLALLKGAHSIIQKLKLAQFGVSFDIRNDDALKFLNSKLQFELSNYKGNINNNTKEKIAEILNEAVMTGESYTETARKIMAQGDKGVFSLARAEHIAQREIGHAYSKGNRIPIDEFQGRYPDRLVEKKWQTVGDHKVRETHRQNERDGWKLLQERHSGTDEDMAPSTKDFRCRCVEIYRLGD